MKASPPCKKPSHPAQNGLRITVQYTVGRMTSNAHALTEYLDDIKEQLTSAAYKKGCDLSIKTDENNQISAGGTKAKDDTKELMSALRRMARMYPLG